jgi:hypothetical protein
MKNKTEFYNQLLSGKVSDLKHILDTIYLKEMNGELFFKPPYYERGYLQHVVDFAEGRKEDIIILSPKTQEMIKVVYSYYLTLD